MLDYLISRASGICGSQTELSRSTGLKRQKINYLLNHAKKISLHDALLIEAATKGIVSLHDFMEFFSPKLQKRLKNLSFLADAKDSGRLIAAMACEKELSEERKAKKQGEKDCRNLDAQKGRIDVIVAKKYGFGNKDTYRQGKKVMLYGISQVIQMMDEETFSIYFCAKIASLPKEKQENILQTSKNKKEIRIKVEEEIRLLRSSKIKINELQPSLPINCSLPTTDLDNFIFMLCCLRNCQHPTSYCQDRRP